MSVAIKVESLGKKYIIQHEKKSAHYETLSDSLIQCSKNIITRISHPFSKSKIEKQTQEEFWALKDINFEINQGDRVGVIGRNGAGKSTLLKILSRITEPTCGKIHINGRIASLLEVGTGFHPELTGRENIFLNGAVLGMSRVEVRAKFDEIVAFSEVEKFLDTPVKRYSSGMYVRLAFAVAAHLEPEILILDEVLAVGDAQFQKKCLGKMDQVAKDGKTVIFVSHSMGMINELCNSAILLSKGNVLSVGLTQKIIDCYLGLATTENSSSFISEIKEDKEIYFEKIQLLNLNGEASNNFLHNEPIKIVVSCIINHWISDSLLSFYVIDHRGRKIFTQNCEQWKMIRGENETINMIVTIPASFLVPGIYFLTFAITVPNVRFIDFAQDALSFTIIDVGSAFAPYEGLDYGCVFAKCEWTVD